MDLKFSATGEPVAEMAAKYTQVKIAVTRGVGRAGVGLQGALRVQTLSGGLGRKLANAWRLDLYPKGQASANAAALVSTKAPKLIDAFDRGVVITAGARWLAVPTADAPKTGYGGKRIRPSNFPEGRYGPLRFVFQRSGPSFLVVDDLRQGRLRKNGTRGLVRARGKKSLAAARANPDSTVVMFLLYRQVKLRKRLDVNREFADWQNKLPAMVAAELEALD